MSKLVAKRLLLRGLLVCHLLFLKSEDRKAWKQGRDVIFVGDQREYQLIECNHKRKKAQSLAWVTTGWWWWWGGFIHLMKLAKYKNKPKKLTKNSHKGKECRCNFMKLVIERVCGFSCVTALKFQEVWIQMWFLVLWAPRVEYHPAPLQWREDRHLSISNIQQNKPALTQCDTHFNELHWAVHSKCPALPARRAELSNQSVICWNMLHLSSHAENSEHFWTINSTFMGEQKIALGWGNWMNFGWSWQFTEIVEKRVVRGDKM